MIEKPQTELEKVAQRMVEEIILSLASCAPDIPDKVKFQVTESGRRAFIGWWIRTIKIVRITVTMVDLDADVRTTIKDEINAHLGRNMKRLVKAAREQKVESQTTFQVVVAKGAEDVIGDAERSFENAGK